MKMVEISESADVVKDIQEEEVVMDTPVRTKTAQITVPLNKFEVSFGFGFVFVQFGCGVVAHFVDLSNCCGFCFIHY